MALRSWLANFFGRDPADERKIAAIVEKLRADGAEADLRSAEDAERAVASAAAADDARRAARPARRTPARRAPATPPPTKRVKVKREGERRALEEKKHGEEVQFLKRTNAQLKKELETYLAPTKK